MCYLHIKQIAISQERRAILKNYTWSSFIISRVLSNKTNFPLHIHFKKWSNDLTCSIDFWLYAGSWEGKKKEQELLEEVAEGNSSSLISTGIFSSTFLLPVYSIVKTQSSIEFWNSIFLCDYFCQNVPGIWQIWLDFRSILSVFPCSVK